jgi:hypothetical protein
MPLGNPQSSIPNLKISHSPSKLKTQISKLYYNKHRLIQTTRRDTTDQTPTNPKPHPSGSDEQQNHSYRNDELAHRLWQKIFSYQPSAISHQLTDCHNGGAWKELARSLKPKA